MARGRSSKKLYILAPLRKGQAYLEQAKVAADLKDLKGMIVGWKTLEVRGQPRLTPGDGTVWVVLEISTSKGINEVGIGIR